MKAEHRARALRLVQTTEVFIATHLHPSNHAPLCFPPPTPSHLSSGLRISAWTVPRVCGMICEERNGALTFEIGAGDQFPLSHPFFNHLHLSNQPNLCLLCLNHP